ncbi:MAG TPA: hypothetical protein VF216_08870 [Mizugakiibacter sp.]
MNAIDSIFDGLFGYERLMLICGFVLFVFALAAITLMIVQRRDFKAAMLLLVFAVVLMGFPGIAAVKFNQGMVEIDHLREQPAPPTDPQQKQQYERTLANLEQRVAGNPQLQAEVADGYRAIGEVDKAYDLARSVLATKPAPAVRQTLVPTLTAKLEQAAAALPAPAPAPSGSAAAPVAPSPSAVAAPAPAGAAPAATSPAREEHLQEIATVARELQMQSQAAPLPANAHVALANAYVKLGDTQKAAANVEAAKRADPHVVLNPALKAALKPPPADNGH